MKSILLLAISVIPLLMGNCLLAQEKTKQKQSPTRNTRSTGQHDSWNQLFRRLDRDGDRRLSGDEIPPRLAEPMAKLDSNQDGTIEAAEFRSRTARALRRGILSRVPLDPSKTRRARQSKNRTGNPGDQKSGDQKSGDQKSGDQKSGVGEARSDGQSERNDKPQQSSRNAAQQSASSAEFQAGMMRRLDKNGDQVISRDEAPQRMRAGWDRLDRDGNNRLEAAELTQLATLLQRRQKSGQAKKVRNDRDEGPRSRGGVIPKRPGGGG